MEYGIHLNDKNIVLTSWGHHRMEQQDKAVQVEQGQEQFGNFEISLLSNSSKIILMAIVCYGKHSQICNGTW